MQETKVAVRTPMELADWAIKNGAAADQIRVLMDCQLKWQAEEQRLAYVSAMDEFKRNLPKIERTKNVTYQTSKGEASYWHVELDKANEIIGPALQAVGITHTWKPTTDANGRIIITCIFQHRQGHREEVGTLSGPPDTSGSKNSVQAIGSTTFYLERYTLLAGCGIAPVGKDSDAKVQGMSNEAFDEYMSTIKDSSSVEELQTRFTKAYKIAREIGDTESMNKFVEAKDAKRSQFRTRQ